MKIAVYAIALNEEQFVQRWAQSAADADFILLADTGSTDRTIQYAQAAGVNVTHVTVTPWRFDDARNAALAMIPADVDYCIALDLDEVLQPGWRAELEKAHSDRISRPRYKYVWSWHDDGTPALTYGGDKIHARNGYRWKHPVHEVITPTGVETQGWTGLQIHHYPDHSKSRSQYLPLLELAVAEHPADDRNTFYYARELLFAGRRDDARKEFARHLALPTALWPPERAASMRYLASLDHGNEESWLLRAAGECPNRREPWVDLANYYHTQQNWQGCYAAATRALDIVEQPLEYLCEPVAWGATPHDLAALSAFYLGLFDQALMHGSAAVSLSPTDDRLVNNLAHYEQRVT